MGIASPYKHVLSKGVYLNLEDTPEHPSSLIVESRDHDDVITLVSWGPVAMWGPTETRVNELAPALEPDVEDLRYLLGKANENLRKPVGPEDVVSIRCGVRPLGVRKSYSGNDYSLALSRRFLVASDRDRRALAVYGGKLTASILLAKEVARRVRSLVKPSGSATHPRSEAREETGFLFTEGPQVSPAWSRHHEACATLDDYLRRRTNIAQWTPRMGLGRQSENHAALTKMAEAFCDTPAETLKMVEEYTEGVRSKYDALLASV
jgi:glycerol-3-phosphate dehydrogenase